MWDKDNDADSWYQYDTFGRLQYTWPPGDTPWSTTTASTVKEYSVPDSSDRPVWMHTKQRDDDGTGSATYLESWSFYDGLGRRIQSQAESDDPGWIILNNRTYDALGRVEKEYLPYQVEAAGGGYQQPEGIVEAAAQEDVDFIGYRIMDREPLIVVGRLFELLGAHSWPGNVRELENAIESLVVLSPPGELDLSLLPAGHPALPTGEPPQPAPAPTDPAGPALTLRQRMDAYERGLIVEALRMTHNNRSLAAARLGISRATLHDKLNKHGIGRSIEGVDEAQE